MKPLLYVYRVLLTGIHLMRTSDVEANLVTLNEEFRLRYIADLVARKLDGPEKFKLDSDIAFQEPPGEGTGPTGCRPGPLTRRLEWFMVPMHGVKVVEALHETHEF